MLLHKSTSPQSSGPAQRLQSAEVEELHTAGPSVKKVLSESLQRLKGEETKPTKSIRWENGGLLKDFKKKRNDRRTKADPIKEVVATYISDIDKKELEKQDEEKEIMWRKLLSEVAYLQLKESETGLHLKSPDELIEMVHKYYDDTALPKLVELADKLPHVQSLCVHEMVVKACKHILQEVVASVHNVANMAASTASCLNVLLGTPSTGHADSDITSDDELKRKWIETSLSKSFGWQWNDEIRRDLRKLAILHELCQKVVLELVPRDYDMDSPFPFKKSNIISLIPAYKVCVRGLIVVRFNHPQVWAFGRDG
ncbi:Hypothetical predicted protein [Olea europaea subsp. europaea]|uniref:CLU central domain-containing protein n=1 Tax=Olea europaea subsp. europaea TaxID=158383 RepID=A0A8S0Q163_OLEEU|nr:Hypothetical predicted protein [Olea europaea subsp. europaea]